MVRRRPSYHEDPGQELSRSDRVIPMLTELISELIPNLQKPPWQWWLAVTSSIPTSGKHLNAQTIAVSNGTASTTKDSLNVISWQKSVQGCAWIL